MATISKKPDLARLQCQVKKSTLEVLHAEAEAEVVTIGVIVRRVLDEHVARREAEMAAKGGA